MRLGVLIAAVVAAALALGAADGNGSRDCFGAAARDPAHPCAGWNQGRSVVPRPGDALLEPSAPCTPVPQLAPPQVCAFGAPGGSTPIALVGDSHAVHWRATLAVIARTKRWHGLTLYRSRCPFTMATSDLERPARGQCRRWGRKVVRWFDAHPEVRTAFVSQHSRAGVIVRGGRDEFETMVDGYTAAWKALPRSVDHIVIIRDPPYVEPTTLGCVKHALARDKVPAQACALPRDEALERDPAVVAARRLDSPRVQTIDQTHFFCDEALCYPVIGGALVKKDKGHLTRVFAETLAPYFRRKLNRLMASWG